MRLSTLNKIVLALLFGCYACGGGDDSGDPSPDPDPIPVPGAAQLVFPEDDTECNTGTVINDNLSDVTFEWNASQNTDSYEVNVINLNTNNSSRTNSTTVEAIIRIERGVPYEWFVVSKANGTNETTESERWRFYNEGPGVENYAPFPAEAINPERGANLNGVTNVTLEWSVSDIDDDIVSHEVFFGTDSGSLNSLGTTANTSIENVTVASGNVYYWQVVTIDEQENSSISDTFQFRIN